MLITRSKSTAKLKLIRAIMRPSKRAVSSVKILCVSDLASPQLENAAHLRRRYYDIDLVVSCGDLPSAYLDFITSVLSVPLFYVRGNHDTMYDERPPGGDDLHQRILTYKGITFVGLEGSMRYNEAPVQYTEGEMSWKVSRLFVPLKISASQHRKVDIFVTHSPPRGIHDLPDKPHTGFKSFLRFMDWYQPRYLLHGHVHNYDNRAETETSYKQTQVINVYPFKALEIEPRVS